MRSRDDEECVFPNVWDHQSALEVSDIAYHFTRLIKLFGVTGAMGHISFRGQKGESLSGQKSYNKLDHA